MTLFTSFDGRISRRGFWLGFLGMTVIAIVVGLGLLSILPSGLGSKIVQLAVMAVICYIWAAIVIKRLHDRNKPGLPYAAIFMAPGILSSVMKIFMIGHTSMDIGGMEIAVPGMTALIISYVSIAVGLWMLVELGFLKGTSGENRYGPDPARVANG